MSVQAQDFIKGYDPTQLASISPSQLAQMIDAATPASDKGLWVTTVDAADGSPNVPDAVNNSKWQNYGWKRVSANAVSIYVWNPNVADNVVYLKWVNIITAQYAPNTIPGSALINNSVGDNQVGTISASKVSGLPTGLPPTGDAGGDLTGTYPNPTIKALAIDGGSAAGRIANKTINDYNIADVGITATTKLALAAANTILKMKSDASTWEVKDYITGNGSKSLRVNAGATDFETYTPAFSKTVFSGLTAVLSTFTTGGTANAVTVIAHGLGSLPTMFRAVAACIANDGTFALGDEVELSGLLVNAAANPAAFSVTADATNITVAFSTTNGTGAFRTAKKDGSGVATLTMASWKIKVYALV